MDNCLIYILGHSDEKLKNIPKRDWLRPINLNNLTLPIPNTNDMAENRFFLLDDYYFNDCPEYIGVLTWQYDRKFCGSINLDRIHEMSGCWSKDTVWAPITTRYHNTQWVQHSLDYHRTIKVYMDEVCDATGSLLHQTNTFWANNFICHRDVFLDFISFFKNAFLAVYNNHGHDLEMYIEEKHASRKVAYFYERVSMLYFTNRPDITVKEMWPKNYHMGRIVWLSSCPVEQKNVANAFWSSLSDAGGWSTCVRLTDFYLTESAKKCETKYKKDCFLSKTMLASQQLLRIKNEMRLDHLFWSYRNHAPEFCAVCDHDVQVICGREGVWTDLLSFASNSEFDFFLGTKVDGSCDAGFVFCKIAQIDQAISFFNAWREALIVSDSVEVDLENILQGYSYGAIPQEFYLHGEMRDDNSRVLIHHASPPLDLEQLSRVRYALAGYSDTIFVYVNHHRTNEVLLSIQSLRHFMPNHQVFCLNLYDVFSTEYDKHLESFEELNAKCVFRKKVHTVDRAGPHMGLHVTEWMNAVQSIFPDKERVVVMDETNYFTTGVTLREIVNNAWDLAFGLRITSSYGLTGIKKNISYKMLGVNMKLFADVFPLKEIEENPCSILGLSLYNHGLDKTYRLRELFYRNDTNYNGDGTYTEDIEEMRHMMERAGII